MNRNFRIVLDAAVAEVADRFPSYFLDYGVHLPAREAILGYRDRFQPFAAYSEAQLLECRRLLYEYMQSNGIVVNEGNCDVDKISEILWASTVDAYGAALGLIPMSSFVSGGRGIEDLVKTEFRSGQTDGGVSYLSGVHAGRNTLIISATGMPLKIWERFLSRTQGDRRYIVVESRSAPLLLGGTPRRSSMLEDVSDIRSVLLEEDFSAVDVISWCNGSRIGVEIARCMPERIRTLTLIAPTCHGSVDKGLYPSPFEDGMIDIYEFVKNDPESGRQLLPGFGKRDDIERLILRERSASKRADLVLCLPPLALNQELLRSFKTYEFFENYLLRVISDAKYDMGAAISEVRCPIFLVTGTHDLANNARAPRDLLTRYQRGVVHAEIMGAGHHVQWLQCGYLGYLLNCFLNGVSPYGCMRVRTEVLGRAS